jgi:tRNA U38,U39,U40 pseudouridine synthase TruA
VLVTMDYFTKWIEVVSLKNMTYKEVIHFILEHIVHRFSISQTLTTDQGSSFMSHQVRKFVESLKIKLLALRHTTLRPMVRPSLVKRL